LLAIDAVPRASEVALGEQDVVRIIRGDRADRYARAGLRKRPGPRIPTAPLVVR
jgi:hypothetical protein